jgi:flagellar motor switch protein FliM
MSEVVRNSTDEEEEHIPLPDRILGSRDGKIEGKRIKLYDFRRPDKFSREQIRTMQNISEVFTRMAATRLSAALRLPCELSIELVDQMTYSEYMDPLTGPSTLAVVAMEPLKGQAVLHIDAAGTDAMIERLFGSRLAATAAPAAAAPATAAPASSSVESPPSGGAEALASGGITDIEFAQVERVLAAVIEDLGEAWGFVPGIKAKLTQIETEARFCQIVPPNEMIVMTSCCLTIGAAKGMLSVVYPFLLLEPVIHMLSAKYWYERRGDDINAVSRAAARRAALPAEIIRDAGTLTIDALRSLRKGTVIELPDDEGDRVWLRLGGARVAKISGIERVGPSIVAKIAGAAASRVGVPGAGSDPMATLAVELKAGLESLQKGVSEAMATMARHIGELKGGQEDLSDRMLFGQADAAVLGPSAKPFASLAGVPAEPFALFLSNERPQVCALVLSFLDDALGARILSLLPEALQPDVTRRVATMDWVTPQVLSETERILAKKLSAIEKSGFEAGGVKKIVGILNLSPRDTERRVITALDRSDPQLAESIKRSMFVFEDIIILDDESIRAVLEKADERDLLLAMKLVEEGERERLFKRLPADKRERLRAEFAAMGRMRLKDCDEAGMRIVSLIRALEEEGRIAVLRADE